MEIGTGLRVTAGLLEALAQLGNARDRVHVRAQDGHPAVAELDHPVERGGAVTADDDGRVRLLQRLRILPDPVEADEVALIARFALRPDRLHGEHALAQQTPA
jgi:hypothetical protein